MGKPKKYNTEEERKEAKKEYNKQYYQANKERIAEYYQDNKEKIAEQHKQWCKTNKEKIAEYSKQYYQANKEKIVEYYQANREKIAEQRKQYCQDNREKIAEYYKQYHQDNKEKIAEKKKRYNQTPMGRAKNLLRTYKQADKKYNRGKCTLTAKWIVENIFTSKCVYCGESDWRKLGCDRIDNSKPHTPDNVVCSCGECNVKRGSKSFEEFLAECKQKDLESTATS